MTVTIECTRVETPVQLSQLYGLYRMGTEQNTMLITVTEHINDSINDNRDNIITRPISTDDRNTVKLSRSLRTSDSPQSEHPVFNAVIPVTLLLLFVIQYELRTVISYIMDNVSKSS